MSLASRRDLCLLRGVGLSTGIAVAQPWPGLSTGIALAPELQWHCFDTAQAQRKHMQSTSCSMSLASLRDLWLLRSGTALAQA